MTGDEWRPFRLGRIAVTPAFPLRHDSNYALLDALPESASATEVAEEVGRTLTAAGVAPCVAVTLDESAAERLAPGLAELGWEARRYLVMAHHRPPDRTRDLSLVRVVGEAALRTARAHLLQTYPWATPELIRQLLEAKRAIRVEKRFYAVIVDGEAVSWADLYRDAETAQIEDVGTLEPHRGRGYASATVLRAAEDARAAGADLVVLTADAGDWPKELYRRLGFDEIGGYVKFVQAG
jgi:GNAT superfamily N-acetyltransferase